MRGSIWSNGSRRRRRTGRATGTSIALIRRSKVGVPEAVSGVGSKAGVGASLATAGRNATLFGVDAQKKDGLLRISQGVHAYLKEKGIPHVWHVDGHAHDATEWKNNLYYFAQKLFR